MSQNLFLCLKGATTVSLLELSGFSEGRSIGSRVCSGWARSLGLIDSPGAGYRSDHCRPVPWVHAGM